MAGPVSPGGVLVDLGVGLLTAGLIAVLTYAWWAAIRKRARRLWPFEGDRFAVVLATSSATDTGKYRRTASGIGQVRALAVIVPSIYKAWRGRLEVSHVLLSEDMTDEWTRDLVILGGTKNNRVSQQLLDKFDESAERVPDWPTLRQVGSTILWSGREYTAVADQEWTVTRDYGLILRWPNPWNRRRMVVLIAGASTFGTIAGALWYCGQVQPEDAHRSRELKRSKSFAALVVADVRDGHVVIPSLVEGGSLD